MQVANNDHARVLLGVGGDAGRWLVLDKAARRWSPVPLTVFASGGVRLQRRWLVREDFRRGHDPAAWPGIRVNVPDPLRLRPVEGRSDRKVPTGSADPDPFWSWKVRSSLGRKTPTGRLQFYDTRTGAVAEHDAGHPDSEILLVDEHDAVYFRVGDELRRADIEGGGLANVEVVARAPELLVVHWLVRGSD